MSAGLATVAPDACGCGSQAGWLVRREGEAFPRLFRSQRQAAIAADLLNEGRLTWEELEVLLNGGTVRGFIDDFRSQVEAARASIPLASPFAVGPKEPA